MPERPDVYVHISSIIDEPCEIGAGTKIWHFSHIMKEARIGKGCSIGQNVFVGRAVEIGDGCKIQNNVSVYEGVTLEDHVFCGPSVVFTNVINPRSEVERKSEFKPTYVRRGATLGANATVLCGNTVGRYAFIAAGAVVTHNVPDYALVQGVPGRVVSWMCRCGLRLVFTENSTPSQTTRCAGCGLDYIKRGDNVEEGNLR